MMHLKEQISQQGSSLFQLNTFLNSDDIVRLGDQLSKSDLSNYERNTTIVLGKQHVAPLLVHHYAQLTQH